MTGPTRLKSATACRTSMFLLALGSPSLLSAQVATGVDLATMFELGALLGDTNGDGVPDVVNASLVLGPSPSVAETAAAAEVSARLGFETMALDLPIARGTEGLIPIVVGRSGLAAAGVSAPGLDPTSLDSGEGAVGLAEIAGQTWIFLLGGDDDGLLAAARLFAGVLPHTRTLSTTELETVRDDLAGVLDDAGVTDAAVRLSQARARAGSDGIARLVAEISTGDPEAAATALDFLTSIDGEAPGSDQDESLDTTVDDRAVDDLPAGDPTDPERAPAAEGEEEDSESEPSDDPLDYPGLASVEARITGGRVLRLPGRANPDAPGPIASRPGSGAKDDLDLSNVYSGDGLLGGSPIPNRIDAILVPGSAGVSGLPELAARLGLESTGMVVPLVHPAADLERPGQQPTMVLAGTGNQHTDQLADSGLVDVAGLQPGEGLIQLVPEAFGSKSALVVTGGDEAGAARALEQIAIGFPNLGVRGKDRPTVDDVEGALWDALSGHTPLGQAATGLYKLGQITRELDGVAVSSASVLMSLEKADPALERYVRDAASAAFGSTTEVDVMIDNRDVQDAGTTIYEENVTLPSEVDRFWDLMRSRVLVAAANGSAIRIEARLSEPPEVRGRLEREATAALVEAGADPAQTEVVVLSAFKQGYSWLNDVIRPQLVGRDVGEIEIRFRRNDPPEDWPQQAINTPVRWLHEIFPIDEVLARDLGLDLEQVRFEEVLEGPTYEVRVTDGTGTEILTDHFDPHWVLRPYFDRFEDYEKVRVTTGWLKAETGGRTLVDERISTDPETFWDHFQATVLPTMYDHVMDLHDGLPRGGSSDAPFFGELVVELEMSEPDFRLGIDNEIHAPMDALHEEIYFGTIEFFDVLGRNSGAREFSSRVGSCRSCAPSPTERPPRPPSVSPASRLRDPPSSWRTRQTRETSTRSGSISQRRRWPDRRLGSPRFVQGKKASPTSACGFGSTPNSTCATA